MEHRPPADNALPHFLAMMVRAPRAVDLLAKSVLAVALIGFRGGDGSVMRLGLR